MTEPKHELIQQIEAARSVGHDVRLEPGMSTDQLAELEQRLGATVPRDIRELLAYAAGFSIEEFGNVGFRGSMPFEFTAALPAAVPLATDGTGSFWTVDVRLDDGSWGPVLYICHDPPVIIVQAPNLATFIGQVFEITRGAAGPAQIIAPFVAEIWERNPHVVQREHALVSREDALRRFAQELTDEFVIADLRSADIGLGFVWGLAGPDTEVRRAGNELLFATERRKPGLFARLFSRW